jgi:Co/Zn/Cd efflux system component
MRATLAAASVVLACRSSCSLAERWSGHGDSPRSVNGPLSRDVDPADTQGRSRSPVVLAAITLRCYPLGPMDACCSGKSHQLERLWLVQSRTLGLVLLINATMFFVELVYGLLAHSLALLADSLDMLTDALIYALSLYVVTRGSAWKARAALAKAVVMALSGVFVLSQLVYKLVYPQLPGFQTMSVVGTLALFANAVCFAALWRHRDEDLNMRSVWLCSRNDLVANTLVLAAAGGVWMFASAWPDIVVGAMISALFLRSAISVAVQAREELARGAQQATDPQRTSGGASSCCHSPATCSSSPPS